MVAALKKFVPDDFAGRFGAWWNGREYVPSGDEEASEPVADNDPVPDELVSEEAEKPARKSPDKPKAKPAPADTQGGVLSPTESRIAALEVLWGEGRFAPGSAEILSRLTDGMKPVETGMDSRFGVVNGDPALVSHLMGTSRSCPVIAEWRRPCADRFKLQFADFDILFGDLDRPSFEPGSLDLLVSTDAFAFSDHKSGLAVRALRSLAPGGQWIVLDTVRGKAKGSLSPAFASAWAEPQICDDHEIIEVCESAGFDQSGDEDDLSGDVIQASRTAFERFGQNLEDKLGERIHQVNKAVFMRELAWEAESWKWRERALAGELIHSKMWKFRKPAE